MHMLFLHAGWQKDESAKNAISSFFHFCTKSVLGYQNISIFPMYDQDFMETWEETKRFSTIFNVFAFFQDSLSQHFATIQVEPHLTAALSPNSRTPISPIAEIAAIPLYRRTFPLLSHIDSSPTPPPSPDLDCTSETLQQVGHVDSFCFGSMCVCFVTAQTEQLMDVAQVHRVLFGVTKGLQTGLHLNSIKFNLQTTQ